MRGVTPLDKLLEVEDLLVKLIIHYGDEIITVQDVRRTKCPCPWLNTSA